MRIIGHMVTKNEMHRWFTHSLPWLIALTDGVAVYDDRSNDNTVDYANGLGVATTTRPDSIPAFDINEGMFRGAGWKAMERAMNCEPGDWVLAVDADEFLINDSPHGTAHDVRRQLRDQIDAAEARTEHAITFRVPEVFALEDSGWPQVRTDGYWANILACRLVKWKPNGEFHPREEGGGSVPSQWPKARSTDPMLSLMHFGYATAEDQTARHARYARGSGHNPVHVASILRPPSLQRWHGMTPPTLHT